MNFDLNDEQLMLRDSLRKMLADQSSIKVARQMENDPVGYPAALWKSLAEIGILGLTLPEAHGGAGLGYLDLTVAFEELGRALCPGPIVESAVLSTGIVARAGSDAQKQEWLPRLAAGEAVLTPAFLEPEGDFHADAVQIKAEATADAFLLNGTKYFVGYAAAADRLLTLVRRGPGEAGIDILLVDPKAEGVKLTQTETHALDTRYQVDFDNVRVPLADRIGAESSGWQTWLDVRTDLMVALSAWFVGCAERDLELTTAYAKERVQFDRPIGSFQAIAHQLADSAILIAGSRYLTWRAAWAGDRSRPEFHRMAATAFLRSGEAGRFTTRTGQQVFGGIGFTNDLDVQLFFRRAKQHLIAWVDTDTLENFVADQLIDGEKQ